MTGQQNDHTAGNQVSAGAYSWAQSTFGAVSAKWGRVPSQEPGFFAQIVELGQGVRLALSSDGVGTKADVAERLGVFDTLGADLLAMVADDLVSVGARPLFLNNVIDANRIDAAVIDALMKGLATACNRVGVAITGGEIAALGERVGGFSLDKNKPVTFVNWSATGVGVLPPGREPLGGRAIAPSHVIVALEEKGLRSNGYTLARATLNRCYGNEWHHVVAPQMGGQTWGQLLLQPSRVYCQLVADLLDEFSGISGVAHITGGGVPGNATRVLRSQSRGAHFFDLFDPPSWVLHLQGAAGLGDLDAYLSWNMGQGMLLFVAADVAQKVVDAAFEAGIAAKICGIVNDSAEISIESRGVDQEVLRFSVHAPLGKGVRQTP